MKKVDYKALSIILLVFIIPCFIYYSKYENIRNSIENNSITLFDENKAENKVNALLEENRDKELINNTSYEKFVYLSFKKDEIMTHFVVDIKTGEETTILNYIKEDKKTEFFNKIKELLYLKYPKFIASNLEEEEQILDVELLENELIIYYKGDSVEPKIEDQLLLHVNYNEVKDYLDFTLALDNEYENENGYHYNKNKKTVALTFDDGPNGEKTNRLLNILEENKAHATFFMVGNRMESGRDTILNVLNKGNEIGSHSYSHQNMKRMRLNDVIQGEKKTREIYKSITGKDLLYTRPPYGNITSQIKSNLDTIFINWNLDTEDWLHRDKDKIVNAVLKDIDDGDIILMHDSYDTTVEAVEELLPELYVRGYQVVSVSELATLKNITLEQHHLYYSLKEV